MTACVSPFAGSRIEMILREGVQTPGDDMAGNGRPPSDSHFEMYVVHGTAFSLLHFDLVPVIDPNNPCMIEDDQSQFPGLQSSQISKKVREVAMADGTVTDDEAGRIADADLRATNLGPISQNMRAVVTHEDGLTNAAAAALFTGIPAKDMIDDASNATRASMCKAIFAQHPNLYIGDDKVFTIPVNGVLFGFVDGHDPRNSAPIGGSELSADQTFLEFDALQINWQFNDANDPRINTTVNGIGPFGPSETGYHYMAGVPVQRERGVINVSMKNIAFSSISGEAGIFTDLGRDNVQF